MPELKDVIYPTILKTLTHSPSIELSNLFTKYADHAVSGAINFSPSASPPIAGARASVLLTANGINTPTFANAFKPRKNSGEYKNVAGAVNEILFSYDGASFWYSISTQKTARFAVNVRDYGAVGDGVADDLPAFNRALAVLVANGGGCLYVPSGTYLVSLCVNMPSDSVLEGDGYSSCIVCPGGGWALGTTDRFGIVNVRNANNVRITNVRIKGTKTQGQSQTPKLIYFESCIGLKIDSCWIENSAWEGIWAGGNPENSRRVLISNNHVFDVGHPNPFGGLPAIQPNGHDIIVTGNYLENVGCGIGPSGSGLVISNNIIKGITLVGIGTGDGGRSGSTVIANNYIEMSASLTTNRSGIAVETGEGLSSNTVVSGNIVKLTGEIADVTARAYKASAGKGDVLFAGNSAEIIGFGVGFDVSGAPGGKRVFLLGNYAVAKSLVRLSYGFSATSSTPGSGISIQSSGNVALGFSDFFSYAYDFRSTGGAFDSASNGDFADAGYVRVGSTQRVASGEFMSEGADKSKSTGFYGRPQILSLILEPKIGGSNYRVTSGAIDITGNAAGLDKQRTCICVDTATNSSPAGILTDIAGGLEGMLLLISLFEPSRVVTIQSGGNIKISSAISLSEFRRVLLQKDGAFWFLVG
jgi:hypothetical protein